MTAEELASYIGQFVEVTFADGEVVVGRLIDGEPFALALPAAGPGEENMRREIADVAGVTSVRAIGAIPETFD